jgi:hypothetical protein
MLIIPELATLNTPLIYMHTQYEGTIGMKTKSHCGKGLLSLLLDRVHKDCIKIVYSHQEHIILVHIHAHTIWCIVVTTVCIMILISIVQYVILWYKIFTINMFVMFSLLPQTFWQHLNNNKHNFIVQTDTTRWLVSVVGRGIP